MKEFEHMIRSMGEALGRMNSALREFDEYSHNIGVYFGGIERMKNCMNCDHHEVCLIVARRRATKANDYSACSKWKLGDGDNS